MRTWKVGIVGGGPGGLMTAYLIQKYATEPHALTVFEAGTRLGGKILTSTFTSAPASYEAGAAELYDYSPVGEDALRELVAELGLPTRPMGGSAVIINHRVLANLDDIHAHLGPRAAAAFATFDRAAKDWVSPREFYHSDDPGGVPIGTAPGRFDAITAGIADPAARAFVETLIHSDLATEPGATSASYGLHNYVMNDPAYMHLYSIEGGNERLPGELADRIRAEKCLEHRAVRIGREPNGRLSVVTTHHGEERRDEFDFVVLALPNSYLPPVTFEGDRLAGALARHHAHYDHPAHYLRVTILFDRPFWRETFADSYCMLDRFGGCCLYDESGRDPGSPYSILGWLLGGTPARELSTLTDAELIAAALDSLPAPLAHGREFFREGRVHRWVGAVSAMPGGPHPLSLDRRHQPEPVEHPNLFLVGDYLFDSTLNGVLDSADYVAGWIAAEMTDRGGRLERPQ
ncbi:MAG TPA: FAD-dependent oxidoreductase [Gemmata sp.]